jgi:DNA-binding GntR family transcriptional regulator
MSVVYARFGTSNLRDQHELMVRALRNHDARGLKRALVADIRDGMGLIGASGFEMP